MINKKRRKKKKVNEEIGMKEWQNDFTEVRKKKNGGESEKREMREGRIETGR